MDTHATCAGAPDVASTSNSRCVSPSYQATAPSANATAADPMPHATDATVRGAHRRPAPGLGGGASGALMEPSGAATSIKVAPPTVTILRLHTEGAPQTPPSVE